MTAPTLNSEQLPANVPTFIAGGISVNAADARYLRKNALQVNATDYLQLGAAPTNSGAVNIDASTYADLAIYSRNGSALFQLVNSATEIRAGGYSSGHNYYLMANALKKWRIIGEAAGTATLGSNETTARIVGGATNGLAIRDSANARDNFQVNDSGDSCTIYNGTYQAGFTRTSGTGELQAGYYLGGNNPATNFNLLPCANGTTGIKLIGAYYNQTQWYSAFEVANVASGFGVLDLMKSGGEVRLGSASASLLSLSRSAPTYSASITPSGKSNQYTITATNGTAFTINAPTANPTQSAIITFCIRNTSGGALGAVTWNAIYKLAAWTSPATGNSRSVTFMWDGTNYVEISRTPGDVPN